MNAITNRAFLTAIQTGELVINTKNDAGETVQVSKSIFDENGALITEMVDFAAESIAKMDARNDKRKEKSGSKPTAKQVENEALATQIVGLMETGATYTSKDIVAFGIEGVATVQKVTALMKKLVADGLVTATEVKAEGSKGKVKGYALATVED